MKVSARTSLPSASVFPIYTVRPFIPLMMSPGLYTPFPMAFSANPQAKIMFYLDPSSKIPLRAPITAQDPPLSPYIVSIDPVGFKLRPPVSYVTPLPTRAKSI